MKKTRKILSVVLAFLVAVASISMSGSATTELSDGLESSSSLLTESLAGQKEFSKSEASVSDMMSGYGTTNTIYVNDEYYVTLSAGGYAEFIFTPTTSGYYVIGSENIDGDSDDPLAVVCDRSYNYLYESDDNPFKGYTTDFCCIFYANARTEYRILVFEYNDRAADFYVGLVNYAEITHQPTASSPYVEISPYAPAEYQWYSITDSNAEIKGNNIISATTLENTSSYSSTYGWVPAARPVSSGSYNKFYDFFSTVLFAGDTVTVETDGYITSEIGWLSYEDNMNYIENTTGYYDETYYFNITSTDLYSLCAIGEPGLTARVYVNGEYITSLSNETDSDLGATGSGNYFCYVEYDYYRYEFSNILTISGSGSDASEIGLYETKTANVSSDDYDEYYFTPEESGTYVVASNSTGYDPRVRVYDDSGYIIAEDDDNDYISGERDFYCVFDAEAGETYRIELFEYYGNSVSYNFEVIEYAEISHQPSVYEPYVEIEPDTARASYQWYEVSGGGNYTLYDETDSELVTRDYGEYVCEVDFGYGRVETTESFEMVELPEITVNETKTAYVPYGDYAEFVFRPTESGMYAVVTDSSDMAGCDPVVGVFDHNHDLIVANDDNRYLYSQESYCPFYADEGEIYFIIVLDYYENEVEFDITLIEHGVISHHPNTTEPYVNINPDVEADYQWYSITDDEAEITDSNVLNLGDLDTRSTYSSRNGWTPAEEVAAHDSDLNFYNFFDIHLESGSVVTVETDGAVYDGIGLISVHNGDGYAEEVSVAEDDTYTFEIDFSDDYSLICYGEPGLKAKVYVDGEIYTELDGETDSTLRSGAAGEYACKVGFSYGRYELSDSFVKQNNITTTARPSTTTRPATTRPATTRPVTTVPANAVSVTIRQPSRLEITYGDSIILHADIDGYLPSGARIDWTSDNTNFTIVSVSDDGRTCEVTPNANGETVFTAKVVDSSNNVLSSDTQTMFAKAGFFQKIIAFFKKLFGLTTVFPEVYKNIF